MSRANEIKQRIQEWAADVSRAYPFLAADPAAGEREPPSSHLTPSRLRASLRDLLLAMIRDGLGARSPDEVSEFVASVAAIDMVERRAQVDVPKIADWLVGHRFEVDASAPALEPTCVDGDHHPLDPRTANGYTPAPVANDPAWTPEERASRLGCLYGAATIGRCGEPVGKGKRYCGKHGRHEPPVPTDDHGADLTRPSPDRAAWLLHPVSSTGRETIAASQYEELRAEAVALRKSVIELEAEVAKERAAFTGANTAWSRAVVLQEQAQDERDAMRARAEEAERKLSAVSELQRSTAADLDAARAQLRLVSAGPADVWRWQGDGHNDPASLACPVVMSASTLREFVAARERVTELESERSAALVLLEAEPELGLCKGVTLAIQLARHEAVAASSRWFSIPEHQRLDRIGQIVDQLADVRHELDDDDIEAAEALIDLAKGALGAPSPLDLAVGEVCASPISQHSAIEIESADDAIEVIGELHAEREADTDRSLLLSIARVALAGMLACDAADATAKGGAK